MAGLTGQLHYHMHQQGLTAAREKGLGQQCSSNESQEEMNTTCPRALDRPVVRHMVAPAVLIDIRRPAVRPPLWPPPLPHRALPAARPGVAPSLSPQQVAYEITNRLVAGEIPQQAGLNDTCQA